MTLRTSEPGGPLSSHVPGGKEVMSLPGLQHQNGQLTMGRLEADVQRATPSREPEPMYYQGTPTPESVSRVYRQLVRQSREFPWQRHSSVTPWTASAVSRHSELATPGGGRAMSVVGASKADHDVFASPTTRGARISREDVDWLLTSTSDARLSRRANSARLGEDRCSSLVNGAAIAVEDLLNEEEAELPTAEDRDLQDGQQSRLVNGQESYEGQQSRVADEQTSHAGQQSVTAGEALDKGQQGGAADKQALDDGQEVETANERSHEGRQDETANGAPHERQQGGTADEEASTLTVDPAVTVADDLVQHHVEDTLHAKPRDTAATEASTAVPESSRRTDSPVTAGPPSPTPIVTLHRWFLTLASCSRLPQTVLAKAGELTVDPSPLRQWFYVEGQKREADGTLVEWHSTKIAARVESHLVQTTSGSLYRLVGSPDGSKTRQRGFSAVTAEAFADGFPEDWMGVVCADLAAMEHEQRIASQEHHMSQVVASSSHLQDGAVFVTSGDDDHREEPTIDPRRTTELQEETDVAAAEPTAVKRRRFRVGRASSPKRRRQQQQQQQQGTFAAGDSPIQRRMTKELLSLTRSPFGISRAVKHAMSNVVGQANGAGEARIDRAPLTSADNSEGPITPARAPVARIPEQGRVEAPSGPSRAQPSPPSSRRSKRRPTQSPVNWWVISPGYIKTEDGDGDDSPLRDRSRANGGEKEGPTSRGNQVPSGSPKQRSTVERRRRSDTSRPYPPMLATEEGDDDDAQRQSDARPSPPSQPPVAAGSRRKRSGEAFG